MTQQRLEWTPTASEEEHIRRGARAAILAALSIGPMTGRELVAIAGTGFSSRLFELRKAGHKITTKMVGRHGLYILEGDDALD